MRLQFHLSLAVLCLAAAAAAQAPAPAAAPLRLTLPEALARAQANSPAFQAALVAEGVARDNRAIAHAATLPSLTLNNNYIWTQDNIYVANDGPHEFVTLGDVHQNFNFALGAAVRQATAGQLLAQAQAQIAQRGLAAVVTADYYTLLADEHESATARQALTEAQNYLKVSQDLERGGEVAHADVIQAQLQLEQSQSALRQAALAHEQAKLGLAVLLFPNFNLNYTLADDLGREPPLPSLRRVQALAALHNPILATAEAQLDEARQGVKIAHAALLPSLSLDYFYGIDAHEYSLYNQYHQFNPGSSVMGMLSIPLFHWGANRARVHQAQLLQRQAQVQLSFTQRSLVADLQGYYAGAQAARDQLAMLARSRALAAESLRLVGLRYRDGEATILELVSAQAANTAARNAYNNGEVAYRVALANLQTLTGVF
jgi:outer membrane protein TolC